MKPSEASEQTIFDAARQMPDLQARAAYLDAACDGDPRLRGRLEKLLQANQRADEFLAGDPLGLAGVARQTALVAPISEAPGTVIDRYKLLEKLGEGGFGAVYMAEQTQPVKRRVALKIIKVGMDTREVVARFEAERQALALMDHPNIAKVLDGGATETGRPYFVMELVRGTKITEYCDERNLSTRERLDLFTKVCQAVQHAHQKGIIHRDLKPSNILVTVNDGVAVPKIIDFGIAKATQLELTEKTVFTRLQQFIGTPAYMSPEQAEMSSVDIDTRSDIYSLGVLLYELLTGRTPFDTKELLQAGLDEMRRTIREKEPARPSTRLSTLDGDELTTTAKRRGLEPPKLISQVRGDLDWIVMKCLEKDRARRFETANGLAMDIQRHLNSEPVAASPPSNLYRLKKLIRRNQVLFAATGAVALALVLGLGLSTWLFFRERAARHEQERLRQQTQTEKEHAQTEAAKSQQVAQFLKDMLNSVSPSVALGQDTTLLRGILDKTSQRVGIELTNQPQVELDLRNTLSGIYLDLSLYKEAQDTLQAGLKRARAAFGEESLEVAFVLGNLGYAQWGLGEFDRAEATEREALRIRQKNHAMDELETARIFNNLGLALVPQAKFAQAEEAYRQALDLHQKFSGKDTPELAMVLQNLAVALGEQGKLEDAVVELRKVLEMRRKLVGLVHPDVAVAMNDLAACLVQVGKLGEAEEMLRDVVDMQRKLFGSKHHHLAVSIYNLASCLKNEGKLDAAEDGLRQSLAMVRDLFGNEHVDVAATLHKLAIVLKERGKLVQAEDALTQALNMNRKLLGDDHPETVLSFLNLRAILVLEDKLVDAERLSQEQVAALRAHPPADALQLADALGGLVATLVMEKKFSQAEPLAREGLTICEAKSKEDCRTFAARNVLGGVLVGVQKYAEAELLLLSGYQGLKERQGQNPGQANRDIKFALQQLVNLFDVTGQTNQSTKWKLELEESRRGQTNRVTAPL